MLAHKPNILRIDGLGNKNELDKYFFYSKPLAKIISTVLFEEMINEADQMRNLILQLYPCSIFRTEYFLCYFSTLGNLKASFPFRRVHIDWMLIESVRPRHHVTINFTSFSQKLCRG